ncbi:competence type IV pilus major pilin ComGC [Aquibacillus rhizosphaerae]|uniref:Type II secretion system protein n=1 Tax=Aquibacillus rhizosphaerae TaxID=3051431 RepID=A0ABT7LAU4_9BACI|nr:type II secretion system protein [Aquibacillus sp. LR5S19]MDL4841675.1 type II secretion system protein [Aquibacillus sp. LR5S19]
MLKKVLKRFKSEKGFTLVELLAVIVILGIIVAIAIPSIGGIINKAQSGADEAETELIIDAARLAYVESGSTGDADYTVSELISNGFLELNDERATALKGTVSITVDTEGKVTYDYSKDTTTGTGSNN